MEWDEIGSDIPTQITLGVRKRCTRAYTVSRGGISRMRGVLPTHWHSPHSSSSSSSSETCAVSSERTVLLSIVPIPAVVVAATHVTTALETSEAVVIEVEARECVDVVEEEDREDENVENAVENHLACHGKFVRAFGKTPADGVQQPEEGNVSGTTGERTAVVVAEKRGGATTGAEEEVDDVEHEGQRKSIVAPLVSRRHECAEQARDDQGDLEEQERSDFGERERGGEDQLEEQKRSCNGPEDVPDIPNAASPMVPKLGVDPSLTQVTRH